MPTDTDEPTESSEGRKPHACRTPGCTFLIKGHPHTNCRVNKGHARRMDRRNKESSQWFEHDGREKKAVSKKPLNLKVNKKRPRSSTAASDQAAAFFVLTPDDFGHGAGPSYAATSDGQGVEDPFNAASSYQGHGEGPVQTHSGFTSPILGNLEIDIFLNQPLVNGDHDYPRMPGPNHIFYSGDLGINGPGSNSTGRYGEGSNTYNAKFIPSMMNPQGGENAPLNAFDMSLPLDNLHYQPQGIYDRIDPLIQGGNEVLGHNEFPGHHDQGWLQFQENPDLNEYGQTYQAQGTNTVSGHGLSSSFMQGPQGGYDLFGGGHTAGNSSQSIYQTPEANHGHFEGPEYRGLTANNTQMTTNIGPPWDSMYEGCSSLTPEPWYTDALTPGTDGGPITPHTSSMHNVALPNVDSGTHAYYNSIYSSPLGNPSKGSFLWEGSHMSPGVDHPTEGLDTRSPRSQYYGV